MIELTHIRGGRKILLDPSRYYWEAYNFNGTKCTIGRTPDGFEVYVEETVKDILNMVNARDYWLTTRRSTH